MASSIGSIFGALVATFLVSRLALWLARPVRNTPWRIWLAHTLTLAFCVVAGAYGFATGSQGPLFEDAAIAYGPFVVLWLFVDLVARRGGRATRTTAQPPS